MSSSGGPGPMLLLPEPGDAPRLVALVLHGGREESREPVAAHQLAVARMVPFARAFARVDGVGVARLHYRYRGWNGVDADPVADVAVALARISARYRDTPVVLVGHSMGGRAAVHHAAHPAVRGLVLLAPWLLGDEEVEGFAGREVAVLHGTQDLTTRPDLSAALVRRVAPVARHAVCIHVRRSGHAMVRRARLWHRLSAELVAAIAAGRGVDAVVGAAPATDGADGCVHV